MSVTIPVELLRNAGRITDEVHKVQVLIRSSVDTSMKLWESIADTLADCFKVTADAVEKMNALKEENERLKEEIEELRPGKEMEDILKQ
jgi:cell shape-determining protein MreC